MIRLFGIIRVNFAYLLSLFISLFRVLVPDHKAFVHYNEHNISSRKKTMFIYPFRLLA